MDQTLNFNASQCVKEVSHFGYTTYMNICAQTQVNVPWGGVDWAAAIFFTVLAVIVVGLLVVLLKQLLDL